MAVFSRLASVRHAHDYHVADEHDHSAVLERWRFDNFTQQRDSSFDFRLTLACQLRVIIGLLRLFAVLRRLLRMCFLLHGRINFLRLHKLLEYDCEEELDDEEAAEHGDK